MICGKCKTMICCQAFDEGECIECGKKIVTSHMPCHQLCKECAEKLNACEQCGEKLSYVIEK